METEKKLILHDHSGSPCSESAGCGIGKTEGEPFQAVCVQDRSGRCICLHVFGESVDESTRSLLGRVVALVANSVRDESRQLLLKSASARGGNVIADAGEEEAWISDHGNHTHDNVSEAQSHCQFGVHHQSCNVAFPPSAGWTEADGACTGSTAPFTCEHQKTKIGPGP